MVASSPYVEGPHKVPTEGIIVSSATIVNRIEPHSGQTKS